MSKNIPQILLENKKAKNTSLDLSRRKVSDLPKELSDLTHLEDLQLNRNNIKDISIIGNLKRLKKLNISGNQIEDISPLQSLKELKELSLGFNPIINYAPLEVITQLEVLKIRNSFCKSKNELAKFDFIQKLTNLKVLDLEGCAIRDINLFNNNKQLVHLNLNQNDIQDIDMTFFEKHPKLEFIAVYENLDLSKRLMIDYWFDYFLSENCIDDLKRTLNSSWYKNKYLS